MTILTVRKQAWVAKFKRKVLRGDPLNVNVAVESRYARLLSDLVDRMTSDVERVIEQQFKTPEIAAMFAHDAGPTDELQLTLNGLSEKHETEFADASSGLAENFVNQSDRAAQAAVTSSLQKISGGMTVSSGSLRGHVKDVLKAAVAENTSLIRSIASRYLSGVASAVMRSVVGGNGLQDLVPYLAQAKGITKRRARMIALDQSRKTFNALARIRMQQAGITEAEWLHTGGSNHPRPTHLAMNGKSFPLDEGLYDSEVQKKVLPGELINCRCRQVPVINFGD